MQAPARSLILSFNGLLMHASFKQQNKPWLWHKFARTWLFLNLNPCVFLYQAQITDSVQQQHFHNHPKLSHSTNQCGVAKYSRLNWRRKLDFPVSLHACCWFPCCISPSSFLMTNCVSCFSHIAPIGSGMTKRCIALCVDVTSTQRQTVTFQA